MMQRHGRATRHRLTHTPRRRDWSEGNGAVFALIAAMVVVMAVLAFTLSWNVPLGPNLTVSAPATTGQGGIQPDSPQRDAR
jgi:hypothetical protein